MSKDIRKHATDWTHERACAKYGLLPTLEAIHGYAEDDHVRAIGNSFFKNAGGTTEAFILFHQKDGDVHYTLYVGAEHETSDTACIPMLYTSAVKLLALFDYICVRTCTDGTIIHVGCDDSSAIAKGIAVHYRDFIDGTSSL